MLSPIDFILQDSHLLTQPDFLETSYFYDDYLGRQLDVVTKISDPDKFYRHSPEVYKTISIDQLELSTIYIEHFNASISLDKSHLESSPYFPGIRFMSPGIIVFERPPMYQIIDIDNDYRDNINDETSSSQYYLPIPWQIYVCTYNPQDMRLSSVKMFFTDSYLSDVEQEVFAPPMFNFYSNGVLCRPFFPSMDDIEKYSQDINGVIASAYDWVWNSGFNYDITENISYFLANQGFEQFAPWAESKTPVSINYLRQNKIRGLPRLAGTKYISHLLNCWQSVPLEHISELEWPNYTNAEFYYQEINNVSFNFFYDYISANNISICDEDLYDEDNDEYYEHDCDGCVSEDFVRQSEDYQTALQNASKVTPKTIANAILESIKIAKSNGIILKDIKANTFTKLFINISQKYFSEG